MFTFTRYQRNESLAATSSSPSRNNSTSNKTNPFQIPVSSAHHQKSPTSPATTNASHGISSLNHQPGILYTNPYGDSSGYLQMALGAYLSPASGGAYKSVDPYFLSQGEIGKTTMFCIVLFFNRMCSINIYGFRLSLLLNWIKTCPQSNYCSNKLLQNYTRCSCLIKSACWSPFNFA